MSPGSAKSQTLRRARILRARSRARTSRAPRAATSTRASRSTPASGARRRGPATTSTRPTTPAPGRAPRRAARPGAGVVGRVDVVAGPLRRAPLAGVDLEARVLVAALGALDVLARDRARRIRARLSVCDFALPGDI